MGFSDVVVGGVVVVVVFSDVVVGGVVVAVGFSDVLVGASSAVFSTVSEVPPQANRSTTSGMQAIFRILLA